MAGKILQFTRDTLRNLVSAMGSTRDKAAMAVYGLSYLTDEEIIAAYKGSWLPRKIVDIPALDSVAMWRLWDAKPEQIKAIEAEERRLGLQGKVKEAKRLARLWGGAAILIGDGSRDPSQPLNPERIAKGGLKYLAVMSNRQLTVPALDLDPGHDGFGKPLAYQIVSTVQTPAVPTDVKLPKESAIANKGAQVTVHPSRIAAFIGAPLPDPIYTHESFNLGWGDSVLQAMLGDLKNAEGASSNIASLIYEAKIDVVRIPNLMNSLSDPEYRQRLTDRFSLAMANKGINQTLILDKDEEYEQKNGQFTNLDKILMGFLQLAAGAADIPLTRLLGQSPGGLNATGEHDMQNYHNRIRSEQRLEMTPAMSVLDECLIRSALGARPKAITYEWAPLEEMDPKDTAEIGQIDSSTAVALAATKMIPRAVLAKSTVNQLVEAGVYPGLDQAMEEFLKENPTYYKDLDKQDEEERQANLKATQAKATVPTPARTASASAGFND